MLSKEQRKEAIHKYKERKPNIGVFAVRCTATGRIWVGGARDLDAGKNSTWFSLRHAGHRDPALQAEWDAHGESAFVYEVLEKLDEDVLPMAVADLLGEKKKNWAAKLSARPLL